MEKKRPSKFIPTVSVNNLVEISFVDMLDGISPYVLEEVPEDLEDGGQNIDKLLAKFANLYTYLLHLYSFASYEAMRFKMAGMTDQWKNMVRKKDALYELAKGVKMKWRACSRMITYHIQEDGDDVFDKVDYKSRKEAKEETEEESGLKGWTGVT